jgi:SsrA-binding protein
VKQRQNQTKKIINRRARHDYELGDSLVVGIQLTGGETKALRLGHGNLRGSYVVVKDNELWLLNATISGTNNIPIDDEQKVRSRKLLARQKEIKQLIEKKNQGLSIIPTEMMIQGRYIKLRISVGRGKKMYDKRETLKKRDEKRRVDAELKRRV